jgi:hypothetical protein
MSRSGSSAPVSRSSDSAGGWSTPSRRAPMSGIQEARALALARHSLKRIESELTV